MPALSENALLETNALTATLEATFPASAREAETFALAFLPASCDFCGEEAGCYKDPATGFRFCLDCLARECECQRHGQSLLDPVPDFADFN